MKLFMLLLLLSLSLTGCTNVIKELTKEYIQVPALESQCYTILSEYIYGSIYHLDLIVNKSNVKVLVYYYIHKTERERILATESYVTELTPDDDNTCTFYRHLNTFSYIAFGNTVEVIDSIEITKIDIVDIKVNNGVVEL